MRSLTTTTVMCLAAVSGAMFPAACASSDQEMALAALQGSYEEDCLKQAHWTAVTRSGAVTFDPSYEGTGFVDFEAKRGRGEHWKYIYDVELVGRAKSLLLRPVKDFLGDYVRAGSPTDSDGGPDQLRMVGRKLLNVEMRPEGRGSLRGIAKGWLSREDKLVCATDSLNGRYFIIAEFQPAFPVSVR